MKPSYRRFGILLIDNGVIPFACEACGAVVFANHEGYDGRVMHDGWHAVKDEAEALAAMRAGDVSGGAK